MSELNVINYIILCNCNGNSDFFILCNCNLLKMLPNYILNYTRAYNLVWLKLLRSHCGHLLKVSGICTNKQ